MKIFKLTEWGDPILRREAKKIPLKNLNTASFKKLTEQMFLTLRKVKGVGLAAPQINKSIQFAVIEIKKSDKRSGGKGLGSTIVVNPKIIFYSKEKVDDWEGCLSFPNARGLVPRAKAIKVRYYDKTGKLQIRQLQGFQARVFQHEIDHLNGVVYIDRMKDMKTLMTLGEFEKRVLGK